MVSSEPYSFAEPRQNGARLRSFSMVNGWAEMTADELDVWVRPNEVKGIEVYAGIGAPMEYQVGLSGCGSILIWTK